ncbi:MAG: hypothetical protein PHP46_04590 [Candidatus Omnitrophica bacterium]|nr:hypothetical protein [Candidatus Omnitrophota bacterium]
MKREDCDRRTNVLLEEMNSSIKVIAEGHGGITNRLDKIESRLGAVESRLGSVEGEVYAVKMAVFDLNSRLARVE